MSSLAHMEDKRGDYMPDFQAVAGQFAQETERRWRQITAEFSAPRAMPPEYETITNEIKDKIIQWWPRPCEALFEYLATNHPRDLVSLVQCKNIEPTDLTFALEWVGEIEDSSLVRSTLISYLEDESAIVREGAIYGLQKHLDDSVEAFLQAIAQNDPSEGVRLAAQDALDEM